MLPIEAPFKTYSDLNGRPLDGGFIYIGAPDQNPKTTAKAIFWDAEGTEPALQPLRTLNGYIVRAGTPANVFIEGEYSTLVENKDRVQIAYAPNSTDFSSTSVVTQFLDRLSQADGSTLVGYGSGTVSDVLKAITLKSIAALRLLSKAKVSTAIVDGYYAARDGGGGLYSLDANDNTTIDNGGTVIVAADGGRWKLSHSGTINVKQFGAKGNGTTDDRAAIQAAFDTKLIVEFTREKYILGGSLVIPDSAWINGNGAVFTPTTGATVFTTAPGAQDIHLHGLQVVGGTAGNFAGFVIDSPRTWITECTTTAVTNGVVSRAASFYMSACDLRASGSALTFETNAEVRSVENCILTGAGSNVVITGGAGLRIVNCDLLGGGLCMLVNPSVLEVSSLKVIGVFFDQGTNGGIRMMTSGTGTIRRFKFDSCWFVGSPSGSGVTAGGNVVGLQFANCEFYGNGENGLTLGTGVSSVTITGSHISGNTGRGLSIANVDGVTVTGCTIGPSSGYPGNGIGVETQGTTNNYLISSNRIGANTINISDGATGTTKLISNNLA